MEAVKKLAEDQGGGERPKHSLDRVIDQPMLAVIFIERMHCLSLRKRHKSPDTRRLLKGDCVYPLANARASWLTASWCFSLLISAKLRAISSCIRWRSVICR